MSALRDTATIARYSLREALRRRIFLAAVLLAVSFVTLFALGVWLAFRHVHDGFDPTGGQLDPIVAPTLFGLAVFAIHFLGAALAVFLSMSSVRGDAERGLLQQLVVRPLGRTSYLAGRLAGTLALALVYVAVTYGCALAAIHHFAHWHPPHTITPLLLLLGSITIVALIVTTGSVWLNAAADGILAFVLLGLGLFGGLMGQLGRSLPNAGRLQTLGAAIGRVVPSETLYQGALNELTRDEPGIAGAVVRLGPFGGSQAVHGTTIAYVALYAAVLLVAAAAGFARRDL